MSRNSDGRRGEANGGGAVLLRDGRSSAGRKLWASSSDRGHTAEADDGGDEEMVVPA